MLKRKKPPKRGSGRKGSRGEDPNVDMFGAKCSGSSSRGGTPTTRGKFGGRYIVSLRYTMISHLCASVTMQPFS